MCAFYKKNGKCTYGDACFKAHGQEELRGQTEPLEDFLVAHRLRNPHVFDFQVRESQAAVAEYEQSIMRQDNDDQSPDETNDSFTQQLAELLEDGESFVVPKDDGLNPEIAFAM